MKVRIIGSLLVIAVLCALAYVTELPTSSTPPPLQTSPAASDNAFKDLKIN